MPSEPVMVRVGQRLRAARIAAGLTVREAAQHLGLPDHSLLVRYENGLTQPSLDRLETIASSYHLTLTALFAPSDAIVPLLVAIEQADEHQLAHLLAAWETLRVA